MADTNLHDSIGEKPEAEPERLRYSIVEPPPEGSPGHSAQANPQDPKGEPTEEEPERLRYTVIEPPPPPPDEFARPEVRYPVSAGADAKQHTPKREPAVPAPPAGDGLGEQIRKFSQNPIKVYIAAGVGLGILFGCVIAAVSWHLGKADGPYDLGPVTSSGFGLKGHLYTKWDQNLQYHLTLAPSDPDRQAGFALAVSHSPRPLSIEIHLQDAQGFVLCSRDIVLKLDAASAPALAALNQHPQAGSADAANVSGNPPSQGMQDLWAAQEAERELGKDVFQNEIGPDGTIVAINAQGEIPCSEKAYANTSSWSFTPDFPSLAEQDELRKGQEVQANGGRASGEALAPRRKPATVAAPKLLPFSIEGDDAIVDWDASRGIIETREGKTFYFDKTSGEIVNPRWQDYPVGIHYRCDQTSTCILSNAGAGALRVRLGR